jgi:hypothetical protein
MWCLDMRSANENIPYHLSKLLSSGKTFQADPHLQSCSFISAE